MRIVLAIIVCAAACSDPGGADVGTFDSGIHDAEAREAGATDAEPDAEPVLDVGVRDAGSADVPRFDAGGGVSCEDAIVWPSLDAPLIGDTRGALHHERFECAGLGGGAIAPERWVEVRFDQPTHAIVRLGTFGWDAVMAVRTSTCAALGEIACLDAPTIVELPDEDGLLFFGVDGFTDGQGPFVLLGEAGPPLTVPPTDAICELAPVFALPLRRIEHNFGADHAAVIDGCPLEAPVFVPIDLQAPGELSLRADPQAGQDVSIAVLSGCGETLACAAQGGAGHAEVLRRLSLPAGRATLVVGSPPGAREGSVAIKASLSAGCVEDADCLLGERCLDNLTCGALAPANAVAADVDIPDDGRVVIPLDVSAVSPSRPPSRVRLRLAIEHEFPRDLVVTLASPGGGPRVRLRDRLDGTLDSVYGKDRPADGPGTMFDFGLAATATGTWTLEVEDRAPGDVGRVTGAVLEVE